jgi:hypothetical protein
LQKHTKVYLSAFYPDHCPGEYIPCERCAAKAVDIHHIDARGMGGTTAPEVPENLMALCKKCHMKYGDIVHYMQMLVETHVIFMEAVDYEYDESKLPYYLSD